MSATPQFNFDNSYARELRGFYVPWQGEAAPDPAMVQFNAVLASELGLDADQLKDGVGAKVFTGSLIPEGAAPLAQAYAGHQFGGFSPQLGDGRAMLLGEVMDLTGARRDIQLKGSGRTPFSRGGDGKAVIGPVLREYLLAEAMHALGVPSTRALAVVTTGEHIQRDGAEPGAILARVASSHLRVGTFQFFHAREETAKVKQLADYAIKRHYPDLAQADSPYLALLHEVINRQCALIAKWVSVGFVHGVMNTDNMTISGETIDYGPCAFIDKYDPQAVFSSIDHHARYAYGNQPVIAQWNLARFAETLIAIIDPENKDIAMAQATAEIERIPEQYQSRWLDEIRHKLGLQDSHPEDLQLANDLHAAMDGQSVDFTQLFAAMHQVASGEEDTATALFDNAEEFKAWIPRYLARIANEPRAVEQISQALQAANPVYVPRNHKVEEALQAAKTGDYAAFYKILEVLAAPFDRRAGLEAYAVGAGDDFGPYVTYCGT